MSAESERVAEVAAWLAKADADLRGSRVDLAIEPPLAADAMFHAQQAAEKALKGFLAWHDVIFRKTHDIGELGRACIALDATLAVVITGAVPLTEFAWRFRYPGDVVDPTKDTAAAALTLAEPLVAAIAERLRRAGVSW